MDALDLANCLKKNKATKNNFVGVFPANKLPLVPIKVNVSKKCLIANTANDDHEGKHWVAFVITKNNVEYFDTLGGQSIDSNKHFKKFVKVNLKNRKLIYNKIKIQSSHTTLCGEYAGLFILFRCKNKSFDTFLKTFSNKKLMSNDYLALKLFDKNFINCRTIIPCKHRVKKSKCKELCKRSHECQY